MHISRILAVSALLAVASTLSAQTICGGQGDLQFKVTSATGSGPFSTVTFNVMGDPNQHICMACDLGLTNFPTGLGTLCIDLASPHFLEFIFPLPPGGNVSFPVTLPGFPNGNQLCCQMLGLDLSNTARPLMISNAVCMGQPNCTSGGVKAIGYTTVLQNVTTFPITVTSSVVGSSGGSGSASVVVPFNPANPPSFPITSGALTIENIAVFGTEVHVTSLVQARPSLQHQSHANRLPNNLYATVSGGGDSNAGDVHVSCSQPIGVGMTFGDFTVTALTFPN